MDHSAGLAVSVKETSVCIVDDTGRIVREVKDACEQGNGARRPANNWRDNNAVAGLEKSGLMASHFGARINRPLPKHCLQRAAKILRPGCSDGLTGGNPV